MLTRQGLVTAFCGVAALVVGRVFGVVELFVIGAGFFAAVVVGVLYVSVRKPSVTGVRWIHPSVLVAGDTGRVDLQLHNRSSVRTARFVLHERVSRAGVADHVAELDVEPLAGASDASAGYRLPTSVRGVVTLGPLVAELRDPLGVARRSEPVSGLDRVVVAPRAHVLAMPNLGSGPLGRHLAAAARRLGPGDFHSLREYLDGDEPRTIHWRASARSEDLLVKQHTIEGLRRVLVVLDGAAPSYADPASFERAIVAAASIVRSAVAVDLTTRFVTGGGVDLRGPTVADLTLGVLAELRPTEEPLPPLDRDPGEGVGLIVVISGRRDGAAFGAVAAALDPSLTLVPVTTDEAARSTIAAAGRTEQEFVASWSRMCGGGQVDRRPAAYRTPDVAPEQATAPARTATRATAASAIGGPT